MEESWKIILSTEQNPQLLFIQKMKALRNNDAMKLRLYHKLKTVIYEPQTVINKPIYGGPGMRG
jgi:hypothetical protein